MKFLDRRKDFSETTDKCLLLKAIHPEFQELTQWDF